jgi:mRNA interferase MazF
MKILQGDIFMADLSPTMESEQAGFRPVLVIQNNTLNKNLNTVIIVPITGNLRAKGRLTTFLLNKENSDLKKESIALLFQIRTIDKARLKQQVGHLQKPELDLLKIHTLLLFK